MKTKNIVTVLLVTMILTSCVPAATVIPEQTAIPTSTLTPAPPTITPTPAPENLADAKDLSIWIDQYVHAYGGHVTVNGVDMDASQLTDEIRKNAEAFTQTKEFNGVAYLFLVVNGTPLAFKQSDDLKWKKLHLKDLADNILLPDKSKFLIGNYLSDKYGGAAHMTDLDNFNVAEFNMATLTMAAHETEPTLGQFPFLNSDGSTNPNDYSEKVVALGQKNNMVLRSADLVYGNADFQWGWAKDYRNATRDELIKDIQNHITTVMTHFKGRITQWNVVNEVSLKAWHPGNYDPYAELIGDDYVDIAFRTARQADPSATLIYNATMNETSQSVLYQLTMQSLKRLRNETVMLDNGKTMPLVDTLGMQMHLDGSKPPTKQQLLQVFKNYSSTGVNIFITEMDVDMSKVTGTDQERFAKQAQIYKTVIQACLESKVCTQVAFWGVAYGWLGPNAAATILNDDLTPKPAYYAVTQALYEHLP